jgi:penicillin-binding protein 1A
VTFDDLSQPLKDAIVATEDVRFYEHSGIDARSLARVGVKTFLMGNRSKGGGGSTLTQQLAKSLFPRDTVKSKIPGAKYFVLGTNKFKEWITAVKLERNYTKEEILSMYMNAVFFGSNAYGIKAAAQTFFGKEPIDLNIEESALLVGMVNMPTRYNPVRNPEKSLVRRNHVIGQMYKYGYITKQERDSIRELPITLSYSRQDHNAGLAPHFRDMIKRVMSAKEPQRKSYSNIEDYRADSTSWMDDPLYGWLNKNLKPDGTKYNLDKDGLKIYTPVNAKMQQYAEEAVREHLGKDLQRQFNRELRWKNNRPFDNEVPKEVIASIMKQARRWSDRYREMKRNNATDEEIVEAAKLAGAHEFILGLPDGYNTYVGERGVKLSGGQKQRVSIARVFLKNPPILILDEATSALDNESEKLVQESLEKLAKGRTTFTIAHRLTTIRNADRILVLTEDGIKEEGTHAELISKGGIYSDLYKLYSTL